MYIICSVNKEKFLKEIINGTYGKDDFKKYGYVHCSDINTFDRVAPNFKNDDFERLIIVIDTDKLKSDVKWENGGSTDYPHIYGLINKESILEILPHIWSDKKEWIKNEELVKYEK